MREVEEPRLLGALLRLVQERERLVGEDIGRVEAIVAVCVGAGLDRAASREPLIALRLPLVLFVASAKAIELVEAALDPFGGLEA